MVTHRVELLPATPTFLRMMLLTGVFDAMKFPDLRVITYGTERMDPGTLARLAEKLPGVDLRQTYGLSELGVFHVKSKARDSLWMQIGGKGIETRVVDDVLQIRSANRMVGYLNAPSPFDDGWYDTGDIVEQDGEFIKVVGRAKEILRLERHPEILAASAGTLTQFLLDEMQKNSVGLLDADTRRWVEPALTRLGRRFLIDDFEGAA
jgi:long-subunit acyl-CoA synthetase (AMP-forming)